MKSSSFLTCFPELKTAFVDRLVERTPGKHFSSPPGKPAVFVVFSKANKKTHCKDPVCALTQMSYSYSAQHLCFLNITL